MADYFDDELGLRILEVPGAHKSKAVQGLYFAWKRLKATPHRDRLLRLLDLMERRHRQETRNNPFAPSPRNELYEDGDIPLPAWIRATGGQLVLNASRDLGGHCSFIAANGSGKSTTMIRMIQCVQRAFSKIRVWVFCMGKPATEYLPLNSIAQPYLPLELTELRVNPYEAIGDPLNYAAGIASLHAHAHGYFSGPMGFELQALHHLYSSTPCPTIFDVVNYVNTLRFQPGDPRRTAVFRLQARLNETILGLGKVVDCVRGMDIKELGRRNLLINCMGNRQADLVVHWLIWRLLRFRDVNGDDPEVATNLLIFDDAVRFFSRQRERSFGPDAGVPQSAEYLLTSRSRNVSMMVSGQSASMLGESVASNTGLKFIGRLPSGTDLNELARTAGCETPEQRMAVRSLKQGQFLVSTPRWPRPFVVEFEKP